MGEVEPEVKEPLPTEPSRLFVLLESNTRVADVCQALRGLIDPSDDHYSVQKELAELGAISVLVDLLDTESEAELSEVCETIAALCANIEGISVRKKSGLESGFFEMSFNPVQDEMSEVGGMRKLTDLLDSESEVVKEAVLQAISACCSFNHRNQLNYLSCLIHDLRSGNHGRVGPINSLVQDLEMRADVTVVLDQALFPLLEVVRDKSSGKRTEALFLMSTLVERHPASAVRLDIPIKIFSRTLQSFLCEEGALGSVIQIVLQDKDLRKKAIHVLWNLIKHNKKLLHPVTGRLGVEGTLLIDPLVEVISGLKDQDTEGEAEVDEEDYSDEAVLLLKALAEQDEEVREKVGDLVEVRSSRCRLM